MGFARPDWGVLATAVVDDALVWRELRVIPLDPADVLGEIESITRGFAGEQPPTNPLVVLKAARWWYIHGKGGTDPAFQWAIEWTRHLATDTPSDVERLDEFLEYLVTVGFADEHHELR